MKTTRGKEFSAAKRQPVSAVGDRIKKRFERKSDKFRVKSAGKLPKNCQNLYLRKITHRFFARESEVFLDGHNSGRLTFISGCYAVGSKEGEKRNLNAKHCFTIHKNFTTRIY